MVDICRMLELLNYSSNAFELMDKFEFTETYSGILCSEEMCPDINNPSIHIAILLALGDYKAVEEIYDPLENEEVPTL